MSENSHDIDTLNGLIATTLGSVKGYTQAAKESDPGRYGALFTSRVSERQQVATRLQQQVATLGGKPEDDGTIVAGAHRLFINLKAAVTGHEDKAIINEVEAGEDHTKARYEDALVDRELSPAVRTLIEEA